MQTLSLPNTSEATTASKGGPRETEANPWGSEAAAEGDPA